MSPTPLRPTPPPVPDFDWNTDDPQDRIGKALDLLALGLTVILVGLSLWLAFHGCTPLGCP